METAMKRMQRVERECVEALAAEVRTELIRGNFSGWVHQAPGDDMGESYRFARLEALCAEHPLAQDHLAAWTVAAAPAKVRAMALAWRGNLQNGDLRPVAAFVLAWRVRELGQAWGAPNDDAIFRRPTSAQVRAARRRPAPYEQPRT